MKSEGQIQWETHIRNVVMMNPSLYKNKKIFIFGVTEESELVMDVLAENSIPIFAVLDNAPEQCLHYLKGHKIQKPNIVKKYNGLHVWVFVCRDHMCAKYNQMLSYGVPESNITYFGPPMERTSFGTRIRDLFRAWCVYSKWRTKFHREILLCPYPGTGDAYLTGRYLHDYLQDHKLSDDDYTIAVIGKGFANVLKLFGYVDNVELITLEECDAIKILLVHLSEEFLHIHFMLYWGLSYQTAYRFQKKISFNELFQYTLLGHPASKIKHPKYLFQDDEVNRICVQYKILEGKSVILAPQANSFDNELSNQWWSEMVSQLKEKGFRVFTNTNQDDQVIRGTKKLFVEYNLMPRVLERCGYLLGVRSGLFDLFHDARCKKIIVYPDFVSEQRMSFISVKHMFRDNDVIEFKLDTKKNKKAELMKKILSCFE